MAVNPFVNQGMYEEPDVIYNHRFREAFINFNCSA